MKLTAPKRHRLGCERLAQEAEAKALAISEMCYRLGFRLLESPGGISWIRFRSEALRKELEPR